MLRFGANSELEGREAGLENLSEAPSKPVFFCTQQMCLGKEMLVVSGLSESTVSMAL